MIIELLTEEHRNIERLLAVLEHELDVFDSGNRPDYEVIRAIISYFQVYPEQFHHPQEDLVFARLKVRDPAAAARIGDLAGEHEKGASRCGGSPRRSMPSLRTARCFGKPSMTSFGIS